MARKLEMLLSDADSLDVLGRIVVTRSGFKSNVQNQPQSTSGVVEGGGTRLLGKTSSPFKAVSLGNAPHVESFEVRPRFEQSLDSLMAINFASLLERNIRLQALFVGLQRLLESHLAPRGRLNCFGAVAFLLQKIAQAKLRYG